MEVNRRIRVLFVPQWYPSRNGQNQVTGTFCREHVRAAALHDDVAVLVFGSRSDRWPTLHWERVEDAGVPTFYATFGLSPVPKTSRLFFYVHLLRAMRRVMREWGRPDLIHTQDAQAYYVMKALHRLRIPFVISQHWSGFMEQLLDRASVRRFRWAFDHAVRVLPTNKFAETDYERYDLNPPTRWLPNVVDGDVFRPAEKPVREPYLLHASGLTREKRVPEIIQAFARVRAQRPEAVLEIAGDGKNRSQVESHAKRELPRGSYRFLGLLSKSQLADRMRQASGFVLASDAETFGCVLMEAMACGCPVLTTRIGGIPAVVREGEGLFAEVGNIDHIAQGMLALLDGTHGLDLPRISVETCRRFSRAVVGRILHEEHVNAARRTFDCADRRCK